MGLSKSLHLFFSFLLASTFVSAQTFDLEKSKRALNENSAAYMVGGASCYAASVFGGQVTQYVLTSAALAVPAAAPFCIPVVAVLHTVTLCDSVERLAALYTGHEPVITKYNPTAYLASFLMNSLDSSYIFKDPEDFEWNRAFEQGQHDISVIATITNGFISAWKLFEILKGFTAPRAVAPDLQRLLDQAITVGNAADVRRLLNQGADPNAYWRLRPEARQPLLHVAAIMDFADIAQALIDCGANIHARDSNDLTALHHAAHAGNQKVFEVLVRAGANPYMNVDSITPLWFAKKHGFIFAKFAENLLMETGSLSSSATSNGGGPLSQVSNLRIAEEQKAARHVATKMSMSVDDFKRRYKVLVDYLMDRYGFFTEMPHEEGCKINEFDRQIVEAMEAEIELLRSKKSSQPVKSGWTPEDRKKKARDLQEFVYQQSSYSIYAEVESYCDGEDWKKSPILKISGIPSTGLRLDLCRAGFYIVSKDPWIVDLDK